MTSTLTSGRALGLVTLLLGGRKEVADKDWNTGSVSTVQARDRRQFRIKCFFPALKTEGFKTRCAVEGTEAE